MAVDPNIIKKLSEDLDNLNDVIDDIAISLEGKLNASLINTKEELNEITKAFKEGKDITKELESNIKKINKESEKLSLDRKSAEAQLKKLIEENNKEYVKGFNKKKETIEQQLKEINAQLKLNEAEGAYLNLLKEESDKRQKISDLTEPFKKKLKDINKEYLSTLGILKFILDAALRFNDISVKTGKELGYGADQADRVTSNLVSAARLSGNLNFTLKNAAAAMGELNTATGGVAEYSADTLETQIMLTKQFGLTGEEAAGIYKFSVLTGKASSVVNKEIAGAFASTRNMVKGSANFKATIAEVAKTSGQLAINFKNSPAAITAAVVQAQALGTTLEQARDQGKQLLDFESSIENELRAELLTGQQMNLERARAAALMGDQVTVMKELSNQGMTLEKFQNMNVVAQDSFAKALGLSSDQLSEQLRKQKVAQEQGKSLAQITEEEALEAEKRQAIQDKFNAAIEKLQDLIGGLVSGPVGWLLEKLTAILPILTNIAAVWGTIYGINRGIAIISAINAASIGGMIAKLPVLLGLKSTEAAIATTTAAATVATAEAATFGAATVWIVAGLAAVMGALAGYAMSKADDMVSPGYGKRTILSPEGAIALNDKDTIIAGTNLGGGGGGETISPSIDLTPMINAINATTAAVNRLYSKDSTIQMGAKTVGTTLSQTSTKLA